MFEHHLNQIHAASRATTTLSSLYLNMMNQNFLNNGLSISKSILILFNLLILAGCTQHVSEFKLTEPLSDLKKFESYQIIIKGDGMEISSADGYGKTIEVMHEKINESVQKVSHLIPAYNNSNGPKTIEINVLIKEFRYVSGSSRSFNGISAGEAVMGGVISIKNKAGKMLGKMTFLEKSGNEKWVLSDYTSKQIYKVSNHIVALLTTN